MKMDSQTYINQRCVHSTTYTNTKKQTRKHSAKNRNKTDIQHKLQNMFASWGIHENKNLISFDFAHTNIQTHIHTHTQSD